MSCASDVANGVFLEHVLLSAVGLHQANCADLPLSLPVITDGGQSLLEPITPLVSAGTTLTISVSSPKALPCRAAALSAETPGVRIIPSRGVCGHTDKSIFLLRAVLRALMHRRRVSGRVVQLFAVHLSFGAVASRGALSLLDSAYRFAAMHWMSRGVPWDSLKCEFRTYAGLLSLFNGDGTNLLMSRSLLLGCVPERMVFLRLSRHVSLSSRATVVFWSALASAVRPTVSVHGSAPSNIWGLPVRLAEAEFETEFEEAPHSRAN